MRADHDLRSKGEHNLERNLKSSPSTGRLPFHSLRTPAVPHDDIEQADLVDNPSGDKPDIRTLPNAEGLPAWQIVRALRRRRGLSQREFATAAGLPVSTISRIEANRVQPRFDTMETLLTTCGFVFIVAEAGRQYDPLVEDQLADHVRDEAWRHPPAHLPVWPIRNEYDPPWWGWGRVAWTMKRGKVPSYTYYRRPKPDSDAYRRWNDAT